MATKTTSKKSTAKKTATKSTKATSSAKTTSRAQSRSNKKGFEMPLIRRAKSASWLAIVESLIVGALGIMFLLDPNGVKKTIFYIVGVFLIIKGVYKIINFFVVRGKYDFYNNDLLYGIIALVFGIIAIVLWEPLGRVIGAVVGAWLVYGSLVRLNIAFKMHAAGIKEWFYVMLLSLVMMALGIYMIVSIGWMTDAVVVIGLLMILGAIISIVDDIFFIRNLDALTK